MAAIRALNDTTVHIRPLERTARQAQRLAASALACGLIGGVLGLIADRTLSLQFAAAILVAAGIVVGGTAVLIGFAATILLFAGLIRRES